jgi:hypothetical protein
MRNGTTERASRSELRIGMKWIMIAGQFGKRNQIGSDYHSLFTRPLITNAQLLVTKGIVRFHDNFISVQLGSVSSDLFETNHQVTLNSRTISPLLQARLANIGLAKLEKNVVCMRIC